MKKISILVCLLLTACGTSQTYHNVTTEQRNSAWQAVPLNRIAVVAVSNDRGERIASETVFADRMSALGIETVSSYEFVPQLAMLDSVDELKAVMAERNVDAVLAVAAAEAAEGYDRGAYWEARGWAYLLGSNNTSAWGNLADAASYWQQGEHSLDIGLWDAKTAQPIWHAQTDSNEWDAGSSGVERLADSIAAMLVERGLISR